MNTEQERALLPCPFCGGEARFDSDDDGWNWIECGGCQVATNHRTSAMDDCRPLLAESWNRRAALQSQDREDAQWCADDVREFRRIGKAINRAATDLPENWGIRISLELGAGTVYLSAPDGAETMIDMSGEAFSDQISEAIDHARRVEVKP